MQESCKIAMVAALEREVKPLVRNWRSNFRAHGNRRFKFFENDDRVLVCGGIGAEAARRACEAAIALYHPEVVQSAGFAGALDETLKVGDIFCPRRVINFRDGSSVETGIGQGVLLSYERIADRDQKLRLAKEYGAQAVDMEAAAIAHTAQLHGLRFQVIKAISDEIDDFLPDLQRFVESGGEFRTAAFIGSIAVRPWLWPHVARLRGNSAAASRALCNDLEKFYGSGLYRVPELSTNGRV
jgi:adenosylhomocysteine nucleosidase